MSFLDELKQRKVLRVGAAYAVAAWLLIQVAETIFPLFGFDEAPARIVVIVLAIGFVPALVLAWVFEWTPEGLKRESAADGAPAVDRRADKRLNRLIMAGLALALAWFAFDRFVLVPQHEMEIIESAREAGRVESVIGSYGDNSIAVLPFRDLSPSRDQEYLSDGIAEEILNVLAGLPGLRVISRTSSFAFKDSTLDVKAIASRLKANYVLEGSLRQSGDTIRITAQLVDTSSDTQLWSQTWDRDLSDVLAVEDEISALVARQLKLRMLERSDTELTIAPEAHEQYLRGLHLLAARDPAAGTHFEKAIELDPEYASAHAGLAKYLALRSGRDDVDRDALRARALETARRALELDPGNSDALAAEGLLQSDVDAARALWVRALESNPNDPDVHRWLGYSYRNVDSVRYLEYMKKGFAVAPTNFVMGINVYQALFRFGRYEEAFEIARNLHELDPASPAPYSLAGSYFVGTGHLDEALKSYYRAFRLAPDTVDAEIAYVGWLLIGLYPGKPELAAIWATRRIANNPESENGMFQRIIATERSGRHDDAMKLIAEAVANPALRGGGLGRASLVVARDPRESRKWWEYLRERDRDDVTTWDVYRIIDYAESLLETGDSERGYALVDATLARVEQQMKAGVRSEAEWDLKFYAAILYAMRGDRRKALDYLHDDAESSGLSCVTCLKTWPQLDGLRDDPEFMALIADADDINARWQTRLEATGLLLSPAEVLALTGLDFDPFDKN